MAPPIGPKAVGVGGKLRFAVGLQNQPDDLLQQLVRPSRNERGACARALPRAPMAPPTVPFRGRPDAGHRSLLADIWRRRAPNAAVDYRCTCWQKWNYVVPCTSCRGLLTNMVPSVPTLSDPKSPRGSLLLQKLLLRRMAGQSRRPWRREPVARITRQKCHGATRDLRHHD